MDGSQFDDWARRLGAVASRRAATGLLAGAIGGVLPRLGLGEAAARKKKKCKGGKKRCRGRCIPRADCCTDVDCDHCATCRDGQCVDPVICDPDAALTPDCACCNRFGIACEAASDCCSGLCVSAGGGPGTCDGREPDSPCDFDAQCRSGACIGDTCA